VKNPKVFRSKTNNLPLPIFFPDATRAVIKSLDSLDILNTKTPGILVNSLHLLNQPGKQIIKKCGGIGPFMNWNGPIISDSGGFQVMSLAKSSGLKNPVSDLGVKFKLSHQKTLLFTPKMSIKLQMALKTDLLVVLDDFTPPKASQEQARQTVDRTILWAKQCKQVFNQICQKNKIPKNKRPYLIAVVQGGYFPKLRKECTQKLVEIGFDGLGYGGWPLNPDNSFDYQSAQIIKKYAKKNYLLYGLGIGKPNEITNLVKTGWHIFDCVLPTRDARHKRLYVYNAPSIDKINLDKKDFYSFYTPDKEKYYRDTRPVSTACDCLLCKNYTRSYLCHLFKIGDFTAGRLATIHNLRFYSILMEKLRKHLNSHESK